MKLNRRQAVASALVAAIPAVFSSHALGQESADDFPSRPIRIIVPFAPGASNDTLARMVGTHISESLKQTVVVENRTGAGGDIGMSLAARSKPDGYTLLMTSNAATVSTATKKKPVIDMLKDLQPLTMIGTQPMLLVAGSNLAFDNLAAFIAAAQAAPGKFSYATPGSATPHHLTFELMSSSKNLKMIHVPFPGTAQALNEVIADRVSLTLATTASAGPLIQQGRLKVLAVVAKQRIKEFPNAPTLIEAGLGDLESGFWYGLTAPSGLPSPIAAKLNTALGAALALPQVREQLRKMDIDATPLQAGAYGAFIATDYKRWKDVAQRSGISID